MMTPIEKFTAKVFKYRGRVRDLGQGKFGAKEVQFPDRTAAIIKPKLFSNEAYWGLMQDTLHLREVAAFVLDNDFLKFDLIPPTVLTTYKGEPASAQFKVEGVPPAKMFPDAFRVRSRNHKDRLALLSAKMDTDKLRRLCIMDLIMGQRDRHANNCLVDQIAGEVYAIDNGLAFGTYMNFYMNVFHRFLFKQELSLTDAERDRLQAISYRKLYSSLSRYLDKKSIKHLWTRLHFVLERKDLSFNALGQGSEGRDDFPSYRKWFLSWRRDGRGKAEVAIERMGEMTALPLT